MTPVRLNAIPSGTVEPQRPRAGSDGAQGEQSFASQLGAEIGKLADVRLSAHAEKRLAERNVELTEADRARLSAAVERIGQKGADKSLVLMDNLALLVSARNRTVITAIEAASAKDGVFTNIDSAVII